MITTEEPMLFPWIQEQVREFIKRECLEKKDLINLGIGDTIHHLPECIVKALVNAAKEMGSQSIGYGDELGNVTLRSRIVRSVYGPFCFLADEIMITEGINNSLTYLIHSFKQGSRFGILTPTYPVYRSLLTISRMEVTEVAALEDCVFEPPLIKLDAMILCSPNNPTGLAFSREQLKKWVDWAIESDTILLFDGAYESFIEDRDFPRSIYEIEGAKRVAIEMRSFSKSLGFSGLRLGYFAVPREIRGGEFLSVMKRVMTASTNGVSYVVQQAGLAALSEEGLLEMACLSKGYMMMTRKLRDCLVSKGFEVQGGDHAPYLLWKCQGSSKEHFLEVLERYRMVTAPGVGFGVDGFLRLSGFISEETLERVAKTL
jgi:LL-diaminopimelate aminotransferase